MTGPAHYITAIGVDAGMVLVACRCGELLSDEGWNAHRRKYATPAYQRETDYR